MMLFSRRPVIIAEAGSCHEGALDNALQLIQIAKDADCDVVKFQWWSSVAQMQARRHTTDPTAYTTGAINEAWFPDLKKAAHDAGLAFGCTVYLPDDIPIVGEHVDYWKISSFEARDRALTGAIPRDTRPLFVSTGMQEEWESSYLPKRALLLHCVSAYPCPVEQATLGAIRQGGGYSDHTGFVLTGGLAVAAGAAVLEVHFRREETSPECPDYPVSLSPAALALYVRTARLAALMRGDGRKRVQGAEEAMMKHRVVS